MRTSTLTSYVSEKIGHTAVQIAKVGLESAVTGIVFGILFGTSGVPMQHTITTGMGVGAIVGICSGTKHLSEAHERMESATIIKATERTRHLSAYIGMIATTGAMLCAQLLTQKVMMQIE